MKYSTRFNEDFALYWRLRDIFTFAPYDPLRAKTSLKSASDMSVKEAFFHLDTHGRYYEITESRELLKVIVAKASINLHINEYARERASGFMCYLELLEIQEEFGFPQWVIDSVENQKLKLWAKLPKIYPNPLFFIMKVVKLPHPKSTYPDAIEAAILKLASGFRLHSTQYLPGEILGMGELLLFFEKRPIVKVVPLKPKVNNEA